MFPRDAAVGFTEALPVPRHPEGCCCRVYRGTTRPLIFHRMLLSALQRYCLSPDIPIDAAVGFTEVLPVPTHLNRCCCRVYRGTTCPQTSQEMLLSGLQRYCLSPYIASDAAVGFTEVLPLPRHPKRCCCRVYRGTTSPQTSQEMLLSGLQRYYPSSNISSDTAVGFTEVLPVPRHPEGCCCRVYRGTTRPLIFHRMLLSGLQRHYPSSNISSDALSGLQRYYLSPDIPRDATVGFTEALPVPRHPNRCCCRVYKGITCPHTSQ